MTSSDEVPLDQDPDWIVEPFSEPINADLTRESALWEHHLTMALHQEFRGVALNVHRRSSSDGSEYVEYTVRDSNWRTRLRLSAEDGTVSIAGYGLEPGEQVDPWLTAIAAVTARLEEALSEFQWTAIIGPSPRSHRSGVGLSQEATIGPLSLRPGGQCLVEYVENYPSLYSRSSFWSWPVIVEGASRGYDWATASRGAHEDLNRLCALLSLISGDPWEMRVPPQDVPASNVSIPPFGPFEQHFGEQEGDRRLSPVVLPGWVGEAWDVLADNRKPRDFLNAYYEGLLLLDKHPSLALIAFVATIEAIGEKLVRLERCTSCGTVLRSGDRFRTALRLAVSEPEAKILEKVYGPRSRTAHSGRLHGSEPWRGAPPLPTFFTLGAAERFEVEIGQLGRAAAILLRLVLQNQLDAARPVPTPPDPFESWPKGLIAMASAMGPITIGDAGAGTVTPT